MAQLHVRKVPDEVFQRLKQRAARQGHSMEAEHRIILERALFPERRPGRRLLEALQAGPFGDPDLVLERSPDRGRDVELCEDSHRLTIC
jgi:plasmid stability protein